MTRNVGSIDRIVRIIAGVGALAVGYYFQSYWGLAGLVLIGTAFINWCPIYAIFGMRTCPRPA